MVMDVKEGASISDMAEATNKKKIKKDDMDLEGSLTSFLRKPMRKTRRQRSMEILMI